MLRLVSAPVALSFLRAEKWQPLGWVLVCAVGIGLCCNTSCGQTLNGPLGNADEGSDFFREKVLPLLERNCYQCHSHESGLIKGGLALDYRSGWAEGGDSGPAIVPGDADASLLAQAVRRSNGLAMPPDDPLPEKAVSILVAWIEAGAFDDRITPPVAQQSDWWSLRPLTRPPLPAVVVQELPQGAMLVNAIDHFIQAELSQRGLSFSPSADRRSLLRRLSFDLLGLPPTLEQVREFEADRRPDSYERTVDRILASPAYGERWARHWLDTIHFADTHGFEHDVARQHAWPFRDYVISRLNDDVSWSRFIREQLAADHLFPNEPQRIPALGFLGAGPFDISSFTTAPITFGYLDRDDMLTQTMAAFTSTTVNCARCHAHKFDPISQDDYFALQAVFAGIVKGDVEYEPDPRVAAERHTWRELLDAVQDQSATVLFAPHWRETIAKWEASMLQEATAWQICKPESFDSSEGCELIELDDHSILAKPPYPEREKYVIRTRAMTERIAALRIEVMTHESLPANGPGCASNGNLHLTSIEACVVAPSEGQRLPLRFTKAVADFEQADWTAAQAVDSDPQSAWGIHPQEGHAHAIVAQLDEAVNLPTDAHIEVTLQQAHGRQHIIGRCRLAVTDRADARLSPLSEALITALQVPAKSRTRAQTMAINSAALRDHAQSQLAALPPPARVYAAARRTLEGNGIPAQTIDKPQAVQVLARGELGKPLRKVLPGALSAITELDARFDIDESLGEAPRRAALADWIADESNPLTWRSVANRIWHYHFSRGLCDTPSDLGRMGGTVSNTDLVDWLACEVRDSDQSLKHLHRLIVNSHTYRQSSDHDPDRALLDSNNEWLWRQNRQRLDADCFRDAVLQVAGQLDRTMGGPAVEQFVTSPGPQMTPVVDYSQFDWSSAAGARRSIYRFVWRGIPDPLMEALDFPDLGLLSPTRAESSSPLQSLAMYNNRFVLINSQRLAERAESTVAVRHLGPHSAKSKNSLRELFGASLQREPTDSEVRMFTPLVEQYGLSLVSRIVFNSNEFLFLD